MKPGPENGWDAPPGYLEVDGEFIPVGWRLRFWIRVLKIAGTRVNQMAPGGWRVNYDLPEIKKVGS